MCCDRAACCDCSRDATAALAASVSCEDCSNGAGKGWCDVLERDELENCACVPGVSEKEMLIGSRDVESVVCKCRSGVFRSSLKRDMRNDETEKLLLLTRVYLLTGWLAKS